MDNIHIVLAFFNFGTALFMYLVLGGNHTRLTITLIILNILFGIINIFI
jgi:hypothetical protein